MFHPLSSTHIRESDLKTKDYIKLMFNFEMSYINTNHDDFIGFTQAAANTANEVKKTQTKVENKVIRSGWLSLGNVGMMRGKLKIDSAPGLHGEFGLAYTIVTRPNS